jgi:hypothetical protein
MKSPHLLKQQLTLANTSQKDAPATRSEIDSDVKRFCH